MRVDAETGEPKLTRSELMARVRGKGNKTTEIKLAKLLRRAGLTGWRRHLPLVGTPDFAWPQFKVAVFVDGCFWHGHRNCHRNLTPKQNAVMWAEKIRRNRRRDTRQSRELRSRGWSVLRVWECSLAARPDRCISRIRKALIQRGFREK